MASETLCAWDKGQLEGRRSPVPLPMATSLGASRLPAIDAFTLAVVAESAEATIESLDAATAAAAALTDGLVTVDPPSDAALIARQSPAIRSTLVATVSRLDEARSAAAPVANTAPLRHHVEGVVALDEYAKAVLYNGLGHYHAARAAAERACASDDYALLDGALAELVEASVRSGRRGRALAAVVRLEDRAQVSDSAWMQGVASCARAQLGEDDTAEADYVSAIEWLHHAATPVALGRASLLYGEWLRRHRRRVQAREHLTLAHRIFCDVRLGGFAERARRELAATDITARKRTDDTRLALTEREAQIARLAADRRTNLEIGEQLYLSARTVEWHLRKIFTKLGVRSRRELDAMLCREPCVPSL